MGNIRGITRGISGPFWLPMSDTALPDKHCKARELANSHEVPSWPYHWFKPSIAHLTEQPLTCGDAGRGLFPSGAVSDGPPMQSEWRHVLQHIAGAPNPRHGYNEPSLALRPHCRSDFRTVARVNHRCR